MRLAVFVLRAVMLTGIILAWEAPAGSQVPPLVSSRVSDPAGWAKRDGGGYAYRRYAEVILARLDVRPGDAVLDLGAGDGWWTAHFAERVGPTGSVYAAEISEQLVGQLRNRFAKQPQVKPYLCLQDRPGLAEKSVDLVFISQVYHHLPEKNRVDYWKELGKVVRPGGRVVIIETYPQIAIQGKEHGTPLSVVVGEAERGGWIPVEMWFIPGTQHFLAVFVPQAVFLPHQTSKETPAGVQVPVQN